ncbi:imidazole glycerol phosphate synthase subunit HisH [Dehalococcoidia bacterium]|nr:imidazole glycerol phosphate synthase subunit HisH [Dehalococcoidia bacterium]
MNELVTIVDYDSGNIRSVEKAIQKLGRDTLVTDSPEDILAAKAVIFPGQGASESAMLTLNKKHLVAPLIEVIRKGVPFFGVCLGLQLLLETSQEGPTPCLGAAKGKVVLLPPDVKRPHMGWNTVAIKKNHPVFQGVENGSYFYFVHSYYADPDDDNLIYGVTDYGVNFCSVIAVDNLIATQFHPEKSGTLGVKLYENFFKYMVDRH